MPTAHRDQHVANMAGQRFDLLVIGGGAIGAGIALDAATRGLSVALVERGDFAGGTSSRSSKLVHGGVRYLEAAISRLDPAQWRLVREALAERAILLDIAPHLVQPLRTLVPAYSRYQLLKYRCGLWLYDRAAGKAMIAASSRLSQRQVLASFPGLKTQNLKGGIAYYDAQFDDARMVIELLLTAIRYGATIANYLEVIGFDEDDSGRLNGAFLHNRLDGSHCRVGARAIINATGPWCDRLRLLEHPDNPPLLTISRGSHLVLQNNWTPAADALLIPTTSDGRVLFVLPWQEHTLIGTTDVAAPLQDEPKPEQDELDYLLLHLQQWFKRPVEQNDIRATWAGLRPLLAQGAGDTARMIREHHIDTGRKGLISITGGKWTTYRKMAEETVDHAIAATGLKPRQGCTTDKIKLTGAAGFTPELARTLAEQYGLASDITHHLTHSYGGQAIELLEQANHSDKRRLLDGYPYLRAEIHWARSREMAMTAEDILYRRLRLGFIDQRAADRLAKDPLLQITTPT